MLKGKFFFSKIHILEKKSQFYYIYLLKGCNFRSQTQNYNGAGNVSFFLRRYDSIKKILKVKYIILYFN